MKLSDEALLSVMEIFRKGITEMQDISQMLRALDLVEDAGKLVPAHKVWNKTEPTD